MAYGNSNRSKFGKSDVRFFSTKPPKADQKALAAEVKANPSFVQDGLDAFSSDYRMSLGHDPQENTWKVTLNLGKAVPGGKDCLIFARASTPTRAIALAVYWLSAMPIDAMFPTDDGDGDDFTY